MALKWFNSIALLLMMAVLLSGCSSSPTKSFRSTEIEKRGDEYLLLGDRYRLQGRAPEAQQYYRSAQQIYFKKWQVDKYLLAAMKDAALLVIMNEVVKAREILDKAKYWREQTNVSGADADIALTEAMVLQAEHKSDEAVALMDKWSAKDSVPLEKRQYMRFYRLWKSQQLPPGMDEEEMASELRSIIQKYYSGQLENPEVAYFSAVAGAEYYERAEQWNLAWEAAMQAIEIHRYSEVISQWPRIFLLCSRVAGKLGNVEQAAFYKRLHLEQLNTALP